MSIDNELTYLFKLYESDKIDHLYTDKYFSYLYSLKNEKSDDTTVEEEELGKEQSLTTIINNYNKEYSIITKIVMSIFIISIICVLGYIAIKLDSV